jgi:Ala-tRNA(Pro) deacylase
MYAVDYLRSRRVPFQALLHRPASGAAKRAGSIHVPGRCVAKTVLVQSQGAYVLAVLPASSRIDPDRLAAALGADPDAVRLASPEEIGRIFRDCEPGAIPPFGRLYGLRTVVDAALGRAEAIVFPTNTRHLDLRISYRDFERLEEPLSAEFAEPADPRTPRSANRRRAS